MIRVNLLPVQKSRRRSQGRTQLILFVGVIVIQIAMLSVVYFLMTQERADVQQVVDELEEQKQELEARDEGLDEMITEAESKYEQLQAIEDLDEQRIGPVEMLDELQLMISPIEDEEVRMSQYHEQWNYDWNPRDTWIESFSETDGGGFRLDGRAGDGDDVAEFLLRMNTSTFFDDVELDYVQREGGNGREFVSFEFFGDLDYSGFPDAQGADDES